MFGFNSVDDAWKWFIGAPGTQFGSPLPATGAPPAAAGAAGEPPVAVPQQTIPPIDFNEIQRQARGQRLLNTGLGILAANTPSTEPRSAWAPLLAGLQAGNTSYDQTLQRGLNQALVGSNINAQQMTLAQRMAALRAGQAALDEEARRRGGGAPLAR